MGWVFCSRLTVSFSHFSDHSYCPSSLMSRDYRTFDIFKKRVFVRQYRFYYALFGDELQEQIWGKIWLADSSECFHPVHMRFIDTRYNMTISTRIGCSHTSSNASPVRPSPSQYWPCRGLLFFISRRFTVDIPANSCYTRVCF